MPRDISAQEAFSIIQRVYGAFGWKPDSRSSREQRNGWLESAVAVVHYGHPQFNAAGGDPRWCIKSAGGGRPQSDDVIVRSTDRAYWDIILSAGAAGWSWNLGAHSEPLPAEQQVYPPSQSSLPGGTPAPGPDPDPGPGPTPPPSESETERLILIAIGNLHAKVDQLLLENKALKQQIADLHQFTDENTDKIGKWMVEQAKGVVASVTGELGPKIDAVQDSQCVLKGRR